MSNSFGHSFRLTTFGESHGRGLGAVVDGCPAGLALSQAQIQADLDRRRPGQSALTTPRQEADQVEVVSGIHAGLSLGSPICLLVRNQDARPSDYASSAQLFRPSHADYTYAAKYGGRGPSGGGRASARETVARVAAGSIAKQLLQQHCGVDIVAFVSQVQDVVADIDVLQAAAAAALTATAIEATPVRCPDAAAAAQMQARIAAARDAGDSVGGVITAVARQVPAGWGEPVFAKLEAQLAQAMLSLPACKGFSIGSGFAGSRLRGSDHNDAFYHDGSRVRTRSNNSGGVQGGISNGEPIVVQVAFKPTSTIAQPQRTVDLAGQPADLRASGRHDPCVLPRAVPIVEAMMALVLADSYLRQRQQGGPACASPPADLQPKNP